MCSAINDSGRGPKRDKMVDAELGTLRFIFNFWADAMRSYCNRSPRFAVSLPVKRAGRRVWECVSLQLGAK